MAPSISKNTNTCTCALLLIFVVLFSQLVESQSRSLPHGSLISTMHRRYLLSHVNGASPNGLAEGAVSPPSEIHGGDGPLVDVRDGVRPSNPGHSPGIGHSFVNRNGPAGNNKL
ncbi:hypothetical protein BRADI_1g60570v3 [Brachypodium distachyon]|uniref:Uncharacterized protein n=1 Tax=Brachypodium distachyon TaxID=15368 RepID=I1H4U1_BRADI|nr:hypothetical protein BRADI_1g60570v3 [Brachypodium distachyon]